MKTITRYHYVYRITNTLINKHYYGVRTTIKNKNMTPQEDLGFKYFSSSTDKSFMLDQKTNPKHYKYKVIKIFDSRVLASNYEIRILKKFNVVNNDKFYNKTVYCDNSLHYNNTGTLTAFDKIQKKYIKVTTDEYHKNKNKYRFSFSFSSLGFVSCYDKYTNKYYSIHKNTFNSSNSLVGVNKFKINGKNNPNSHTVKIYNESNKLMYTLEGNFDSFCKEHNLPGPNFRISYNNNGRVIGINTQSRNELRKNNRQYYIGWYALKDYDIKTSTEVVDSNIIDEQSLGLYCKLTNKNLGIPTPFKKYAIFDNNDNIMYKNNIPFRNYLKENNLPSRFEKLCDTNTKIGENAKHLRQVIKPYLGWYVKAL